MNKWGRILFVHSAKDLFKYKSFFLLVFILILADRGLKVLSKAGKPHFDFPGIRQVSLETAHYVFEQLPATLLDMLGDYRLFVVLALLFVLKQVISLWPSSDMRRMHRHERGRLGIFASLGAIGWDQVLWDAIALATLCGLFALWCLAGFGITRWLWQIRPTVLWLVLLAVLVGAFLPLVMAGFSFSSKLAVISRGRFGEKLALFFKLFLNRHIIAWAWLFYLARILVEAAFVVILPAVILLTIDNYLLRIVAATALATPVYSYLKMVSFKFFLLVYRPFDLVRNEYRIYYRSLMR